MPDGQAVRTLAGLPGQATRLAVRADGQGLAAVDATGAACVWELPTGRHKGWQLFPPGHPVAAVAFSPEGRYLATGNPDGTIYLLRLPAAADLPEE